MSKKPVLSIVEPEEASKGLQSQEKLKDVKIRNFWNTCPRKLENLPCEACLLGKQSSKAQDQENVPCDWSVNSEKYHYCFWKLIHEESLPNGKMDCFQQQKIAELLNVKSSNIHFSLKEIVQKLQKNKYLDTLEEYYYGSNYEESLDLFFDVPSPDDVE